MGSANFGNAYPETPLLRHGSFLFSLPVDDVQSVLGDPGANLGSMNMDDLLKNIWTLEESQAMASAMNSVDGLNRGLSTQFSLQKQGSLCLPRTMSAKAVEDVWKFILPQQGNTEAAPSGVNHQLPMSLEDFLLKAGAVKERPPHAEVTLEDFLMKAGMGPTSNQAVMASSNTGSLNQMQPVPTSPTVVPSSHAHRMPINPFLAQSNQLHKGSPVQTLESSNQAQRKVAAIPVHQQASPIHFTLTPSNPLQQQLPSVLTNRQATHSQSSPVPEQVSPNRAFMGFGGFPISRNDGGIENKNGQAAPSVMNSFVATAANALPCPPSSGKTRLDALNSMLLAGQQNDWMNNPYGKPIPQQNQLVQKQAIAEAASALTSVSNVSNGPCLESSPRHLSPLCGGFGAALGPTHGGNAYPTKITFGPCSPLSSEFDEGSPETSNLPLSIISEFGNGQLQRKKRSADPPVERVIERRQRRMIKNRESAARSRARKQAYTVELEAEVSQLKEENMELLRKQEEEAAIRKKQILALMPSTPDIACKGRFLKRTHTGPW